MLGEKLREHGSQVWLVNTGWTGGPYGVGSRMRLPYTRAMVRAVLDGRLADAPVATDPIFGLARPTTLDGVPDRVLDPRGTWADKASYDAQARKLAAMFRENIARFGDAVSAETLAAGPIG
jgi:phosphoenolpyruvate carboxykinase (ATP)